MNLEDFKKQEEKVLKFWRERKIFEKSLEQRIKAKPFVFFEGPPTANGLPHIGHLLTRIYKDLYCRYQTMQGYYVLRRAGWDTHGLPVEIEVEKQLGLKLKKEIENYGVAEFNRRAKESVWKYKNEWEKMTERMGFWLDLDHPYITYEPKYIESVWWVIKQIAAKKLLYQGHKVLPYCTRCGTALSSHEVAQGYQDITEDSVYVKFRVKVQLPTYLLSWTTTPWTLPGNVALAVGEKITYVEVQKDGEKLIVAKNLVKILGDEVKILREFSGKVLIGLEYEPLFDIKPLKSKASYRVYPADFVTTKEGTGIVHTAVMYGEEDYELGKHVGLPTHHTVNDQGRFTEDVSEFAGQYVKDAEKGIIHYLRQKNLLFKVEPHLHTYPFCWRCDMPLLYYAKNSWFIKMSRLRRELIKNNGQINWVPKHMKTGRFGEFIKEAKDWALSRERYWGTPLPVWQCYKCQNQLVVGSLEELEKNRYRPANTYYLLRHGQSTKNVTSNGEVIASRLEHDKYDLTREGVEQIEKTAKKLSKIGLVVILSSPFLRARHSAEIVAGRLGLKVKIDERLKELDHGSACEGLAHPVCLPLGTVLAFDTKRGDGESWLDVKIRVWSVVKELEEKYEGKNILLVSHGDPTWLIENLAENLTEAEMIKYHDEGYIKQGELRKVQFKNQPKNDEGDLDLHRPYIDQIVLKCKKCRAPMKRVPELIDVWFDSGAMPYAQWHYPFENKKLVDRQEQYPADFITEAIDQTRGWFYTLLAIATALGKKTPYKNVIVLGHTLDEKGQKMSKSKGNVIMANEALRELGADPIRWYLYTVSKPEEGKPVSKKDILAKYQSFFGTLENIVRFLELYSSGAHLSGQPEPTAVLDQWLYNQLDKLFTEVTARLDDYDPTSAARRIEEFVINDLSNWWVRRSRKKFQRPASNQELIYVASLLRFVLLELGKVLAPFVPFLAEILHLRLHRDGKPRTLSVHLHDWPSIKSKVKSQKSKLREEMREIRNFVAKGLAQRKINQIKVRQPLASISLKRKGKFEAGLEELLKDELNVRLVEYNPTQAEEVVLNVHLAEDLLREGYAREVIRQIQDMRKEAKYKLDQKVYAAWESDSSDVIAAMETFGKEITEDTLLSRFDRGHDEKLSYDIEKEFELAPQKIIWLGVRAKSK